MDEVQGCATLNEVEDALHKLTDADYAKLMLIAGSFCRSRKFSSSVLETGDLLSEAVLKTLRMEKKWSKRVSIVKHLDKAMENISGHLADRRSKIVPFPEGSEPSPSQTPEATQPTESESNEEETSEQLLKSIFDDDEQARSVFVKRVEEVPIAVILSDLGLTEPQYETVTRRIRRKLAIFIKKSKTN